MLVGTGELVEEGGFAAVLVAHQRKAQHRALRQRIPAARGMEFALLAETRMDGAPAARRRLPAGRGGFDRLYGDLLRVRQTKGQLIAVDAQLHGVAHGGQLDQAQLRAGEHAHIQKMLPQGAFSAHGEDAGALPGFQITNGHTASSERRNSR